MPPTGLASGHPGVDVTPTYPPAQGGAGGAAACTGATGCGTAGTAGDAADTTVDEVRSVQAQKGGTTATPPFTLYPLPFLLFYGSQCDDKLKANSSI
jgi:hypothetical protein